MHETYRKLKDLLDPRERRWALLVFALMLLVAAVEAAGIASVLPFMAVVANPATIHTSPYLAATYSWLGASSEQQFLIMLGIMVLIMLVGSQALKAFGFMVQVRFAQGRVHAIGHRLVTSYLQQPYEWFTTRHTSDLARIVLSEVGQVVHGALFTAMQFVAQMMVVALISTLLIIADPLLAATVAVLLTSTYLTIFLVARHYLNRLGKQREVTNRLRFHAIHETFGGIKDVKVLGMEGAFIERFREPSIQLTQTNTRLKMISELPSFAMQALVFGGMMLVMLFLIVSRNGLQQALPLLTLYAFAAYRLLPALQSAFSQLSELRYSQTALNTLHADIKALDLESRKLAPFAAYDTIEPLPLKEAIELDAIEFRYASAANPTLDKLNLRIPARAIVGLVGTTGSGKTTTVDLILGLLWPHHGALKIDGTPITAANVRAWQRNLGYVPQQIFLADDTIAANIAFGIPRHKVDLAAVERAAKIANLHDFVTSDLPNGYNTEVGERGVRLSGGQRQRIGIARALYHDPEVLIMDEATSALDNLTEKAVMDAVRNLSSRKTIILIAHRLTTVQMCDCIFVLEHGKLVDSGTFDELTAKNARFRDMAEVGKLSEARPG